jgi:hypothetical protein
VGVVTEPNPDLTSGRELRLSVLDLQHEDISNPHKSISTARTFSDAFVITPDQVDLTIEEVKKLPGLLLSTSQGYVPQAIDSISTMNSLVPTSNEVCIHSIDIFLETTNLGSQLVVEMEV